MLAVQRLPNFIRIGQGYHGILRTQRTYLLARSHFTRQLVQICKQMTDNLLVANPKSCWFHLNVRENIRTLIRKVQIVLQDSNRCFTAFSMTTVTLSLSKGLAENVTFRQSPQFP